MKASAAALTAFLRGFAHAFRGISLALRTQRNMRVHALATVVTALLGFWLQIRAWEWCTVILACGAVWAAELLNTSIERLADRVTTERDEAIRDVKDAAAGAVLAISIAAASVGAIIFLPKLLAA